MLYCMLDPLVNLTNDWVLKTAVPVTELRTTTQLMPRHASKKKTRNIDPDTKMFVGWHALRQKLARTPQAFLKAHRGGKWGAWQPGIPPPPGAGYDGYPGDPGSHI